MLHLSKKQNFYWFYNILVIEPTTEVKAESIGAPSVKEIGPKCLEPKCLWVEVSKKKLGRSVHIFGPKRLGRLNVQRLGRNIWLPI
jgi:hypothetical protein